MKKAKLFLGAIAIFSLVGGTLAFKAQKRNTPTLYCTTTSTLPCQSVKHYTTTALGGSVLYCTANYVDGCTTTTRVLFND